MAGRKTKEKIGFKDLVTFAKAGWTPEETNALLDRLEQMGDPNDPLEPDGDDSDDGDDGDDDEPLELDDDSDDSDDGDDGNDDDDDSIEGNLSKLKKVSAEVISDQNKELQAENKRLKSELKNLQKINRGKDISGGGSIKSPEDSLIDAFQSCF